MAKKQGKLNALIFIDTNILLDFYRIRKSEVSMKYLEEIERHKEILILTSQVEMEFKKNRQMVILEAFGEVNKYSAQNLSVPTVLFEAKPVEMIKKAQKQITAQHAKIKSRIERLLNNPTSSDKVFQTLNRVFNSRSEYNLDRTNSKRFAIRKLALKRFGLGYPPRKKSDTSLGDAINWEWIIDCANRTDKHIILVTRDSDYGALHGNTSYLNDWLQLEFRERINKKRKLILTDKLSYAFKLVEIPVSQEMIEEENKVISDSADSFNFFRFQDNIQRMQDAIKAMEFENFYRIYGDSFILPRLNLRIPSDYFDTPDSNEEEKNK